MQIISSLVNTVFAVGLTLGLGALLWHPAYAQASGPPFIVLYRNPPPPDDPNEYVIVVPADTSLQALINVGFRPAPTALGSYPTAAAARSAADNFVMNNFPKDCRKAFSIFINPTTREQQIVEDFAQKPFGFHLKQGGLCRAQAAAIIGIPGNFMVYNLLATTGIGFALGPDGWTSAPIGPVPGKMPTHPAKPPQTQEVQLTVEEIPLRPSDRPGNEKPPVVEEIPESPQKTPPSTRQPTQPRPPSVEEIPEPSKQQPAQPSRENTPQTPPSTDPPFDTSGEWEVMWNWSVTYVSFVGKLSGGGNQWNFQGSLESATWNPPKGSGTVTCSLSGKPSASSKMTCTASFADSTWQGEANGIMSPMLFGGKRKFEFRGKGSGTATGRPASGIDHLDLKPKN
jgi:hypothetical protein